MSMTKEEIELEKLQLELAKSKREMNRLGKAIARETRQAHLQKLIEAGKVVEEAGLLDDYNRQDLYLLLVMNRAFVSNATKENKAGKFDLLRKLE